MKGTKIMSVFQLFGNLILGISGGIISGIIVSRIFLIQGDFQNQINSFELLLRKLGYTSGMLFGIRTVQEFSYDSDIKMHNEMKKEGISTEEEYYKAHIDVNWISKDRLVSDLLKECKKMNTSLKNELMDLHINESGLQKILDKLNKYVSSLSSTKEMSFSKLNELEKQRKEILNDYDLYKNTSRKTLLTLILKDKVMIVLYILVLLIIIATVTAYMLHI